MLLHLHLVGAGLWLGCILVEVAFERALAGANQNRLVLASLHRNVDLLIELPAFSLVLLTGASMLTATPFSAPFIAKLVLGSIAVVSNVYCIWLVLERRRLASLGKFAEFVKVDQRQHKWGAVVLVSVILAMLLGLSRFASV